MAFEETSLEPTMSFKKKLGYSIIGGIIITLATSIVPNNSMIGASNSGYPFPWLSQPLYPIGSPPAIIWDGLIVDIGVWLIVVFLLLIVYQLVKSRSTSKAE